MDLGQSTVARASRRLWPGRSRVRPRQHDRGRFRESLGSAAMSWGRAAKGDTGLVLGLPRAHSLPVRSAGPRPVWSTRMWGSSRLLPLFPGVDPGLELGGGIGEHGPQHGEAAGLLLGRRRAEASRRGSVGRNFGEGIGPALALGQGLVRIVAREPPPRETGVCGFASAGSLVCRRPWHQRNQTSPRDGWHPSRGFVRLYSAGFSPSIP